MDKLSKLKALTLELLRNSPRKLQLRDLVKDKLRKELKIWSVNDLKPNQYDEFENFIVSLSRIENKDYKEFGDYVESVAGNDLKSAWL